MSAVSGISQGLSQFFQGVAGSQQAPSAQMPIEIGGVTGSDPNNGINVSQSVQGSGHHHGHGGHGGHGEFSKIASAVTNALQAAQANGDSDPNETIQNAIAQVLGGGGTTADTSTSGSATVTDPSSETQSSGSSSPSSFLQMLQAFGVDPEQFRHDFKAAVQSLSGNQSSSSSQCVPPGTLVDQMA